jgi:hypothetical protein
VIVLGVLLLLVSRRRRRRRASDEDALADDSGLDRVPWARDDGLVTARATAEIEAIRATGTVPAITDLFAPTDADTETHTKADTEAEEPPPAPEPTPETLADPAPEAPIAELAERDPMAALAALDLQVSAFRTRLDDLEDESGTSPDAATRPDPDAG